MEKLAIIEAIIGTVGSKGPLLKAAFLNVFDNFSKNVL